MKKIFYALILALSIYSVFGMEDTSTNPECSQKLYLDLCLDSKNKKLYIGQHPFEKNNTPNSIPNILLKIDNDTFLEEFDTRYLDLDADNSDSKITVYYKDKDKNVKSYSLINKNFAIYLQNTILIIYYLIYKNSIWTTGLPSI